MIAKTNATVETVAAGAVVKCVAVAATAAAAMAVAAAQPATFDAQYCGFSHAIVRKCIQFASYIARIS